MRRRASDESTRARHDDKPKGRRRAAIDRDDDDCPICRALREDDEARAVELIRNDPMNLEFQRLMRLDDDEFDAWLKTQRADLDASH
jgi:hypothetical protein